MNGLQFNALCAYDLTKGFLFVEDPGPEDIRTDVTLVPDPILIPIGDVLEADRTHQSTVVEGAVVILQCPTGEGTLAAELIRILIPVLGYLVSVCTLLREICVKSSPVTDL